MISATDRSSRPYPGALLAGLILTLQIERGARATRELADRTRKVQDDPKKTDPGGDIRF